MTNRGLIDTLRTEYTTSPDRPSLQQLSDKYGLALRTLKGYSSDQKWTDLRDAYWHQVAQGGAERAAKKIGGATKAERSQRERTAEILYYMRDGLTKLYQRALRDFVIAEGMSDKEILGVQANWGSLSISDRARIARDAPRIMADLNRALELIEGRPTERIAIGDPVAMSLEEERVFAEVWQRAREVERA